MQELQFPTGFLWGSATSSYQIEGGIMNNDWAQAAKSEKVPAAGKATDSYNRYEEDFDIAKSLSQNSHRFSIEWARIEPEEGKFNDQAIEHYREVLRALRNRGLEPFVTLWHFTLPVWFSKKGGFENHKSPEIFARYCEYVVRQLGDSATFWVTINEPMIYAWNGYIKSDWPPFKFNPFGYVKVLKNLIRVHVMSHNVIKGINPELQIGIAKNNMDFSSTRYNLVGQLSQFFRRIFWNHYFL